MVTDDELRHYGVVGMRWGVRRGNVSKAYEKSSRKLDKLDAKIEKRKAKVSKRVEKYNRHRYGVQLFRNPDRQKDKLRRAQYKYERSLRKGAKWVNAMESEFSKTSTTVSKAQSDKGKRYVDTLRKMEEQRVNSLY